MTLAIDDLKPGMWIVVVGAKDDGEYGPFGRRQPRFCGTPIQVKALSLPFVAVFDGLRMATIDVREVELQRVSRQYVRVLTDPGAVAETVQRRRRRKRRREQEPVDENRCPRCHGRIVQRLFQIEPIKSTWHFVCRECGLDCGEAVG